MFKFLFLAIAIAYTAPALAFQSNFDAFCAVYPTSSFCANSNERCAVCHRNNPGGSGPLNDYGTCFKTKSAGDPQSTIRAIENLDCDNDGASNLLEIVEYKTHPGESSSKPQAVASPAPTSPPGTPTQPVVGADNIYVLKKVALDFCGRAPTYLAIEDFKSKDPNSQELELHNQLSDCLKSDFWRGKDGVIWEIAHEKIRPLNGIIGDYNLFTYTQIDNNDTRELLTAQYDIRRIDSNPAAGIPLTTYERSNQAVFNKEGEASANNPLSAVTYSIPPEHRAGMMTTAFVAAAYTMFAAMPRSTAAQMYRAYLGKDISLGGGTEFVPEDLSNYKDYDATGIKQESCNGCHQVLDPATYVFTGYNGFSTAVDAEGLKAELSPEKEKEETSPLQKLIKRKLRAKILASLGQDMGKDKDALSKLLANYAKAQKADTEEGKYTKELISKYVLIPFTYNANRTRLLPFAKASRPASADVVNIPSAGAVLGEPVADIFEWGRKASQTTQFAESRVRDYWTKLFGRDPSADDQAEYDGLVKYLMTDGQYGIEAMLHKLIDTEAYRVR